jgi:hypothetical protein
VATDKELCSLYDTRRLRDRSTIAALRAVYNLGRQHGAQARQEGEMVPVLWVRRKPGPGCNASVIAWLPGVGDLPIGEHILYAFPGTSQPRQEEEATPPPAPAGGLVDRIMETVMLDPGRAVRAIHCVADWLQQRSSTIANGSQWAEVLRRETDRSSAAPPRPVPQPPAPAGVLLEEVARLLANRISTMRPGADCTPLARTVLCVVADAAEKMARDPNLTWEHLTWERVAIWLDVESEVGGQSDG